MIRAREFDVQFHVQRADKILACRMDWKSANVSYLSAHPCFVLSERADIFLRGRGAWIKETLNTFTGLPGSAVAQCFLIPHNVYYLSARNVLYFRKCFVFSERAEKFPETPENNPDMEPDIESARPNASPNYTFAPHAVFPVICSPPPRSESIEFPQV